jgi:hypothetical protein
MSATQYCKVGGGTIGPLHQDDASLSDERMEYQLDAFLHSSVPGTRRGHYEHFPVMELISDACFGALSFSASTSDFKRAIQEGVRGSLVRASP